MGNLFIPPLFDCAACGAPTHGHLVGDESSTLCRDCFHEYIAQGQGATIEERLDSLPWFSTRDMIEATAAKMRETFAWNQRREAAHWIRIFASLVEAFNLALDAQANAEALAVAALPVLRWVQHPSGWIADLGCWRLFACDRRWTLRFCWDDDWCRTLAESPRGYAGGAAESRRACEAALRRSGVAFRTEGE